MKTLVNAYCRRGWYAETIRLFEIVIAALRKHFEMLAEKTMFYVRFIVEIYGQLGMDVKIDQVLETMSQEHEQQSLLQRQIISVITRSSNTKQNVAAYRVFP